MAKRKTPPKRGRPALPKGEALDAVMPLRCRQDELEAFRRASARSGDTLSAWIRASLRKAAGLGA